MKLYNQLQAFYKQKEVLKTLVKEEIEKRAQIRDKCAYELSNGQSEAGAIRGELKQMFKSISNTGLVPDDLVDYIKSKNNQLKEIDSRCNVEELNCSIKDENALIKDLEVEYKKLAD